MIFLTAILALFPASFQRTQGPEWKALAEDLLADAQAQGMRAHAKAWWALLFDTAIQAPILHVQAMAQAVRGTPPVLAGMGVGEAAYALGKHWVGRPVSGMCGALARHLAFLVVGALGSIGVYGCLQQQAFVTSDPDNVGTITVIFYFVLVIALVLSARWWVSWFQRWKEAGFPVVAPLACLGLGLTVGLHLVFVSQFPRISEENTQTFSSYAQHMDSMGPRDTDLVAWTPLQRQQFEVRPNGMVVLKEEHRKEFCAMTLGSLNAQRIDLLSQQARSTLFDAILWSARTGTAVSHGCVEQAAFLHWQTELAEHTSQHPGIWQRTWEPMAAFSPFVDSMTSIHHTTAKQAFPRVLKHCVLAASKQAYSQGLFVDSSPLSTFCLSLEQRWEAQQGPVKDPVPTTAFQALLWRLGMDHTGQLKLAAAERRTMSAEDLTWIQGEALAHRKLWEQSRAP